MLMEPAVTAPLRSIDKETETRKSPDVVSDAFKMEPLRIVRDSALTSAAVEHVNVELCTSSDLAIATVLPVVHADPVITPYCAATDADVVQVVLEVISDVASSASDALTVLLCTSISTASTGHSSTTRLFTMRSRVRPESATSLAGTVIVPTLVSAVVGLLSMTRTRFVPTAVKIVPAAAA